MPPRNVRSQLLVLWEPPWAGPFEPGRCTWCGEPIELRDPKTNALRMLAYEFGADRLWCATCGEVLVEVNPDGPDRNLAPWEADHIVALEDGGAHEPDNFQVLCVPCHRMKTAAEAAARAGRRLPPDASQLALGEIAA